MTLGLQGSDEAGTPLGLDHAHDEAAAAGARDLHRTRPGGPCALLQRLGAGGDDAGGGLLLRLPRTVERAREGAEVAGEQRVSHLGHALLHPMHGRQRRAAVVVGIASLLGDDALGGARLAGEADRKRCLQFPRDGGRQPQRVHQRIPARRKAHHVEPAIGRRILILLTTGEAQLSPLDIARKRGGLAWGKRAPKEGGVRLHQRDDECG